MSWWLDLLGAAKSSRGDQPLEPATGSANAWRRKRAGGFVGECRDEDHGWRLCAHPVSTKVALTPGRLKRGVLDERNA